MAGYNSLNDRKLINKYINNPGNQKRLYKRTLIIIVFSQLFGGAGLAAGITVGALLAQNMIGSDSFAGIPIALFTLGSAGSALLIGRLSQKWGRRTGLASGFLAGSLGAIGVIAAAVLNNLPLLFISLLIYGSGTAANLQARYAGTDLAASSQRATAVSIAMVATTFGAVAGPNLVEVMGGVAESFGIPALAGPFILAAGAFFMAAVVLLIFLRPDPFLIAKALTESENEKDQAENRRTSVPPLNNKRGIIVAASVMVLTQMVMVALMTMTPVHMEHAGHSLRAVGMVIGIHIAAMYLPSLVTGILVDKIGRTKMAAAAGVTLLAAGLTGGFAPPDSLPLLITALALLGLGWNFGLISGTALIVDATTPETRAKTQGTVDVLIALSGASGGALSGMVVAHSSYTFLSLAGGLLSLLLIPVVIWFINGKKEVKPAAT